MPDFFPLPIFPEGGLAGSLVTTVWVGVAVVVFFNQRFGWVLSGLVVPGYIVPLLIAKPAAAAVVLGEGVLTYGLVWLYSEHWSQRFGWSNFFGRDRFFALVLCSVLVRIVADGYLLPLAGEWINDNLQVQFDYRNNLHSFGLIIVALIANNFWKTGLRGGLLPLMTTVGITYLIVQYVLMTLTNFNISTLSYMYEDIAASILASPKAYVVLIATAFLASRMNLLYGWDFAGILVPSLLALQWYKPEKILASFVEATAILLLAVLVLRLPVFRGQTIEGGRKTLLFFNISFAYKFVLAYLVLWLWPEQKITDLYGFGYLLPTLLALKMHDKGIYARMTRATLQTSLIATLGASLFGFGLSFISAFETPAVADNRPVPALALRSEGLPDIVRQARIAAYRTRLQTTVPAPTAVELDRLRQGFEHLARYRLGGETADLNDAVRLLTTTGFVVERVGARHLLIRDREPDRHWGLYVIALDADSNLAIEVPSPLDERGSAEAGTWLFRVMRAQALAIAGSLRAANKDGSADVLRVPNTAYQAFHQVFGAMETLQVRGYTAETARVARGWRNEPRPGDEPGSTLWIKRSLPEGLDLSRLKELVGSFELRWGEMAQQSNLQRDTLYQGFAELQLHRDDMRRLLGRALAEERAVTVTSSERSIEGYLQDWLLRDPSRIAMAGSNLYRVPALEELLFFDDEVVTPILAAAANHYRDGRWSAAGEDELRVIQAAAAVLGYSLLQYRHQGTGRDYLILAEPERVAGAPEQRRFWGTYVFRLGPAEPFAVQVPHPLREVRSFEFAVSLFESLRGRALFVAGADPAANQDGRADVVRMTNKENIFNVTGQALLRHAGDAPMLVVQSRAAAERPDVPLPAADVLLATSGGDLSRAQLTPRARRLVDAIESYGLNLALVGGEEASAGYEAGAMLTAYYMKASRNKEFAAVWVSPLARASFLQQTEATPQQAQAQALGLATREEELARYVVRHAGHAGALPTSLRKGVDAYIERQDIVLLHAALSAHRHLRFERVVDLSSRQGYLAVFDRDGALLGMANLTARQPNRRMTVPGQIDRTAVEAFVDSGAAWLVFGATP